MQKLNERAVAFLSFNSLFFLRLVCPLLLSHGFDEADDERY